MTPSRRSVRYTEYHCPRVNSRALGEPRQRHTRSASARTFPGTSQISDARSYDGSAPIIVRFGCITLGSNCAQSHKPVWSSTPITGAIGSEISPALCGFPHVLKSGLATGASPQSVRKPSTHVDTRTWRVRILFWPSPVLSLGVTRGLPDMLTTSRTRHQMAPARTELMRT